MSNSSSTSSDTRASSPWVWWFGRDDECPSTLPSQVPAVHVGMWPPRLLWVNDPPGRCCYHEAYITLGSVRGPPLFSFKFCEGSLSKPDFFIFVSHSRSTGGWSIVYEREMSSDSNYTDLSRRLADGLLGLTLTYWRLDTYVTVRPDRGRNLIRLTSLAVH